MIYLSCGHTCDYRPLGIPIALKDYAEDGGNSITYSCVCFDCYKDYILTSADEIIWDQQDEEDWFNEGKENQ